MKKLKQNENLNYKYMFVNFYYPNIKHWLTAFKYCLQDQETTRLTCNVTVVFFVANFSENFRNFMPFKTIDIPFKESQSMTNDEFHTFSSKYFVWSNNFSFFLLYQVSASRNMFAHRIKIYIQ